MKYFKLFIALLLTAITTVAWLTTGMPESIDMRFACGILHAVTLASWLMFICECRCKNATRT